MHSEKVHTDAEQRWQLQFAVAAALRAFAPRSSECLATFATSRTASSHDGSVYCALPYYSYRYL
ncbi:hypothetical protein C2L71_06455 [Enteroscipio rubneri]|uniref:Uncharacterized protein n=1 Tax=Enteroscipio rubneri TaxID=2070686 RepID=A0A2K2UBM6_9ACTN|nr:hypothetical protein C2L71_06455 [Enteroscipio rubneri]